MTRVTSNAGVFFNNYKLIKNSNSFYYSDGCGIPDGNSVILTGGVWTRNKVSRYNVDGWLEDLPDLTIGRGSHGCASYTDEDGTKVQ